MLETAGYLGALPLLSPDGATPLWLIRGPPEEPFLPLRPNGPAATKAAAQATTGCGSEVTASQVNRLWQSFQAQGLTELSRLPSVYLSLPGYPILPGQASRSDLFLSYKGDTGQIIPIGIKLRTNRALSEKMIMPTIIN
jgi:hypothetical protein